MILPAGVFLSALGLLAGLILMGSPLALRWGDSDLQAGLTLWILFPLLTGIGWSLIAMGSREQAVRLPTRVIAAAMLILALLAAAGLVMASANVIQVHGGTSAWWYVLVLAGVTGVIGSAAYGRSSSAA